MPAGRPPKGDVSRETKRLGVFDTWVRDSSWPAGAVSPSHLDD